jgi:putative acetyltransferase
MNILREKRLSPDSIGMIYDLNKYLSQLYPPESNHFLDIAELNSENVRFFIAVDAGQSIGCGALRLMPGYGEVKRMWIDPAYRGCGVGKRLLYKLENIGRYFGYRMLRLETGIHQKAAISLYEKMGYQSCDPFGEYQDDPLSLCYEKRIDNYLIKDFSFEDSSALNKLTGELIKPDLVAKSRVTATFPETGQENLRQIVAVTDERLIGFCTLGIGTNGKASDKEGWIAELTVAKEFLELGVNYALLDVIESIAQDMDCHSIAFELFQPSSWNYAMLEQNDWIKHKNHFSKSLTVPAAVVSTESGKLVISAKPPGVIDE